jgi:hypothetical protein
MWVIDQDAQDEESQLGRRAALTFQHDHVYLLKLGGTLSIAFDVAASTAS